VRKNIKKYRSQIFFDIFLACHVLAGHFQISYFCGMAAETDWRKRTELLIGEKSVEKLEQAHVLVIGLGGVGSMAAEMLCRAGIGKLTIADGDQITATNRNRQLPALVSTEGMDKTEVVANRLKNINPDIRLIIAKNYLKDQATVELINAAPYDFVVDAIDTLSPKVYLLFHSVQLGLKVVSSMGSGAKLDPAQILVCDLSETHHCTFAYDIRKRLRRMGVETGIQAVFSPEPNVKSAIIFHDGEKNKKSMVGTISYMPALFGCYCASVVIRSLIGQ
jgi:tRNA threonylcarbamoyladenosine dehydratase